MPTISISWNASLPIMGEPTCPEITTSGIESLYAVAMPVIALVAPGPEVTSATPTLPLTRAYASAAWTAACSWRAKICSNL